ncbi:hypothetical protein [Listeria ivanovii]|uniref:hypothetical protein n=1 Tax=Listeria ivanovii TaxID=1638 RepID=UPI003CEE3038
MNQLESKRRNKQAKTKQKNKLLLAFFSYNKDVMKNTNVLASISIQNGGLDNERKVIPKTR